MSYREEIAVDKGIDNTLSFLLEGYHYISNRTKKFGRNMFKTRLLGGKLFICMVGEEAAEVFYDNHKFKRHGAAPKRVIQTLFGAEGVQTIDDNTHHHRKALFMDMMDKKSLQKMNDIIKSEWIRALQNWEHQDEVVLYEEAKLVLTRSACIWAGVPLLKSEEIKRTKELSALFEAGGAIGARHLRGRMDRDRVEKWAAELITSVREGTINVDENTPLYKISFHKDLKDNYLDVHIASVELINILRPIVAISVYVVFCTLGLKQFPEEQEKLYKADDRPYKNYVQEIRRYYPFFPMVIAQVKNDFLWKGHDFKKDTHVLLDLYGTNHHPDLWENPDHFQPQRFSNWDESPFNFIPQGGGDYVSGHRCPGEWLTVNVMTTILKLLVHHMSYDVPEQNLTYSFTKMPSLPKSKFIMKNIRHIIRHI